MAENNWDSDDDDFDADDNAGKQQNTPKGLRAHAKRLEQENADFRRQLEEFKAANRKATLETAVKAKGLSPKVAGLVPKDIEADALEKWLEDYGDVFGKPEPAPQQTSPEDEQEFGEMSRVSQAAGRGESPNRAVDLYAELSDKNLTPQRLMEMIEAAGGGYGA